MRSPGVPPALLVRPAAAAMPGTGSCPGNTSQYAQGGLGVDVTVAHRGHGDDGPPEGLGDALKQGLWVALLHGVAQGREDKDAHGQVGPERQMALSRSQGPRVAESRQRLGSPLRQPPHTSQGLCMAPWAGCRGDSEPHQGSQCGGRCRHPSRGGNPGSSKVPRNTGAGERGDEGKQGGREVVSGLKVEGR